MTKKDFVLIEDAINKAIESFLKNPHFEQPLPNGILTQSYSAERILRTALSREFAERLKYTADAFDEERFKKAITGIRVAYT